MAYQVFRGDVFSQCIRRAYEDVFSIVELTMVMEYTVH